MIVIAVCGGTGSGKSYLSKKIINQFNKYKVEYLCLDSYYKNYKDYYDSDSIELVSNFYAEEINLFNYEF